MHMVPVEVPRPKTHRVEPVLLSMSVGGHSLARCSFPSRLARYSATPGDNQSRLEGMVRRVYGNTSTSPRRPMGVVTKFRPLISWNLVPRRGFGMARERPVRATPGRGGCG